MASNVQRIRDPIHGLIVFESPIDDLAWKLLETPEFQRLRRIKQLGFSEFTFPSATHNRFSHSIGVFANARRLMRVVEASEGTGFDKDRAEEVLIAALLHDIGHGPFSHAFERAREEIAKINGLDAIEKHEKFSARIIRNTSGNIHSILEGYRPGLTEKVAALIEADDPIDIYHAVVSSSFDADRLDFLVRDRYMTGTGAGSIDEDWLIDNLVEWDVLIEQDGEEGLLVPTFVFKHKGRQAAEDFLLARYRLYTEVYLHKTTRGFEAMLSRIVSVVGNPAYKLEGLGLNAANPVASFLRGGEELADYLLLDDCEVWVMLKALMRSSVAEVAELARRLVVREHYFVLDLFREFGEDKAALANAIKAVEAYAADDLGVSIFRDDPTVSLYSTSTGEAEKTHKIVRVLDGSGRPLEIKDFANTIISSTLTDKKQLIRYYFPTREQRDAAHKAARGN